MAALAVVFLAAGGTAKLLADRYVHRKVQGILAQALPRVEERFGVKVDVGRASLGLNGDGVLSDIAVSAPGAAAPFVTMGAIEAAYDLDLQRKEAELTGLRLVRPQMTVTLDRRGVVWPAPIKALLEEDRKAKGKKKADDEPFAWSLGPVRLGNAFGVRFVDGELILRDHGRFIADGELLRLERAEGTVRLDAAARQARVIGRAAEAGGGKLDYDLTLGRNGGVIGLQLHDVRGSGLAAALPGYVKLTPDTRFNGAVTLQSAGPDKPLLVTLDLQAANVTVAHPRLAAQDIVGCTGGLRGALQFNPETKVVTAKSLEFRLGRAPLRLEDLILRPEGKSPALLQLRAIAAGALVQDLLDGLPEGLIPVVKGVKAEGALNLRADVVLDWGSPGRSGLEVDGDVAGFRVLHAPARCDVRRILSPDFKHDARKKGILQKTIVVGPSDPDFVALSNVGEYLRGAVLTCEDGSFFRHNGFALRHINDSLRRDLREKRFVRGASTISMQLVKNLFLSEEKTLSRKLQEAMLTWWMEKEVKKERMFEVYLNIIEWGPKIYGVGPAARHYFRRAPRELSPIQAAFLGSIIANPTRYYYMKQRGSVGDGWRITLEFIMTKLQERGTIKQEDYDAAAAKDFEVNFASADGPVKPKPPAKPSEPLKPDDAPKFMDKPEPAETPEPAATPKPADAPTLTEKPKPTDTPKPAETPKSADAPTPTPPPDQKGDAK